MAQRILHFVRHGQYAAGPGGGTLTRLGRRQATLAGKRLLAHEVVAIRASDLGRARESATLISEQVGNLPVMTSRALREMIPTRVPGARSDESRGAARRRLDAICERYFRPARATRHEVFVCHGNLIRAMLMLVLGLRLGAWVRLEIHNASITTFSVSAGRPVRLVRFNDVGHLPAAIVTDS